MSGCKEIVVLIENNELQPNEEIASCSSQSTTPKMRNRIKRIPITSAIPLLPTVECVSGPVSKPTPGKQGTPKKVYVNHFPVGIASNVMLYQYDVVVEQITSQVSNKWEEVLSRNKRRQFIQKLATTNAFDFIYW